MPWPFSTYLASHEHKVIYCPIPKVACSSLKLWFLSAAGVEIDPTADMHEVIAARQRQFGFVADEVHLHDRAYLKFAFLRNPLRRLVSAYLDKVVRVEAAISPARAAVEAIQRTRHGRLDPDRCVTFREFAEYVVATLDADLDGHFKSQHVFLGDLEFEFVGRAEELQRGLGRLIEASGFGAHVPLPHVNHNPYEVRPGRTCVADWPAGRLRSQSPRPHWRDFYDEPLHSAVQDRYQRDHELWSSLEFSTSIAVAG